MLFRSPLVEASRGDLRFGAPLNAITAVVVGLIASLALFFAGLVLFVIDWVAAHPRWRSPATFISINKTSG